MMTIMISAISIGNDEREVLSQTNTDLIPSRVALDRRALSRLPYHPSSLLLSPLSRAESRRSR